MKNIHIDWVSTILDTLLITIKYKVYQVTLHTQLNENDIMIYKDLEKIKNKKRFYRKVYETFHYKIQEDIDRFIYQIDHDFFGTKTVYLPNVYEYQYTVDVNMVMTIDYIYVYPEYRRQQYATKIIKELQNKAKKLGVKRIVAIAPNEMAEKLLDKMKFKFYKYNIYYKELQ